MSEKNIREKISEIELYKGTRWWSIVGLAAVLLVLTVLTLIETGQTRSLYRSQTLSTISFYDKAIEQNLVCYVGLDLNDLSMRRIVSPDFVLPSDYVPSNLVTISSSLRGPATRFAPQYALQVSEYVEPQLLALINAAAEAGHSFLVNSAYRGYARQSAIFYDPLNQSDTEHAQAALPGASEHQLGTAVDISATMEGYEWLGEHAREFGFIVSYSEGDEDKTGYIYEPWHIRYVGRDIAEKIYTQELVFSADLNDVFLPLPGDGSMYGPHTYLGGDIEVAVFGPAVKNRTLFTTLEEPVVGDDVLVQMEGAINGRPNIQDFLDESFQYVGSSTRMWQDGQRQVYTFSRDSIYYDVVWLEDMNYGYLLASGSGEIERIALTDFFSTRCN